MQTWRCEAKPVPVASISFPLGGPLWRSSLSSSRRLEVPFCHPVPMLAKSLAGTPRRCGYQTVPHTDIVTHGQDRRGAVNLAVNMATSASRSRSALSSGAGCTNLRQVWKLAFVALACFLPSCLEASHWRKQLGHITGPSPLALLVW